MMGQLTHHNGDRKVLSASEPVNFEDAIKATGFGKFNVLLLFIVVPCSFAQIAEMIGISYVIPIAQCDLNLSLQDKGTLTSSSYLGMLISGMIWGYICDTYGRRKIIIYGYFLNFLCHILAACSQNFTMLLVIRFFSGSSFSGPFSALTSYLSEFHSTQNRAKIQLIRGMTCALGNVILPLIAWIILPTGRTFYITNDIVLHSWNLFFIALSLPALMSTVIFIFMPESPKFLMTQGKNQEALEIFRKVHRINSGKANCYPVKYLIEENQNGKIVSANSSICGRFMNGLHSVKPLFCRPYVFRLMHACVNVWSLCMGVFGLKLWYPQILQSITENEKTNGKNEIGICDIVESLSLSNSKQTSTVTQCTVNLDNSGVYINSIILGSVSVAVFFIGGIGVNKLGKKTLVASAVFIASICPIIMYFFSYATIMMVLLPITLSFGEIGGNVLLTVTLELFPTSFRLTAVNIHMMSRRFAIVLGNIIFPSLLMAGCLNLLMFISLCLFVTVILTSLLPSTENRALQ